MHLNNILCLLALTLSISAIRGEDAPLEYVSITFSVVTIEESSAELWYKSSGEWKSLTVPHGQRSQRFEYQGPGDFIFFESVNAESLGVNPLASINIDQSNRDFLFLFVPVSADHYKILAIDDTGVDFGNGVVKFFNFSKEPIMAAVDRKNTSAIAPLSSKDYSLESLDREGHRRVRVRLSVAIKNNQEAVGWQPVYSGNHTIFPGMRLITLWVGETSEPWTITDFLAPTLDLSK